MAFIRYITKSGGQKYASLVDTIRNSSQADREYLGNLD
jgi:hypothetical protein